MPEFGLSRSLRNLGRTGFFDLACSPSAEKLISQARGPPEGGDFPPSGFSSNSTKNKSVIFSYSNTQVGYEQLAVALQILNCRIDWRMVNLNEAHLVL